MTEARVTDSMPMKPPRSQPESRDTRLKRLRIRSWRRGTREMDMLLGPFADTALQGLDEGLLAAYEDLLEENDWDLYAWMAGQADPGPAHGPLVARIRDWHGIA
ncbi:MAG: succinate dehydrogenase assembly factor 2 [Pseudomonadota bacterium]